MMRSTGTYATSTTLGEKVQAFVPRTLPPAKPPLALQPLALVHDVPALAEWLRTHG